MEHGAWSMEHGAWSMGLGAWGIRQWADRWSMGHGAWSMGHPPVGGQVEHAGSKVTSPARGESPETCTQKTALQKTYGLSVSYCLFYHIYIQIIKL